MHDVLTKRCALRKHGRMPTPDELIPSADVCAEMAIDRSTLSRWVTLGKIKPAIRMPGRRGAMLFNRSDVEALKAQVAA